MNVFIFGCVVFFTMAALVVLIDRFVKQPVAIVEVPDKIELPADGALATTQTYRTIQQEKSPQKAQTADRIITSLDNDDEMWNWDVGAEFRISIKKPELRGLRP